MKIFTFYSGPPKILGLLLVLLAMSIGGSLFGQCAFNNDNFLASSAPPQPGDGVVTLTTCVWGGEHYELENMQAGQTYRFSTCGDDDFDTQITIFDDSGVYAGAFNDDFCGLQSQVDFTPPITGTYLKRRPGEPAPTGARC